jgi:hypothetical protein
VEAEEVRVPDRVAGVALQVAVLGRHRARGAGLYRACADRARRAPARPCSLPSTLLVRTTCRRRAAGARAASRARCAASRAP